MSSRTLLLIFGALVAAGIALLLIAIGSSPSTEEAVAKKAGTPTAPAPDNASKTGVRPSVSVTKAEPGTTSAPNGDTLEYMTDGGVLVRDHRADKSEPANLTGLPKPGRTRRMQPESVAAVRGILRPIVNGCERAVAASSLGSEPVLQVVVTVSVAGEKLTVDKVETHTKDIPSGTELEACVRAGFSGKQHDVPGEPDIAAFDLTHPFRIKGR